MSILAGIRSEPLVNPLCQIVEAVFHGVIVAAIIVLPFGHTGCARVASMRSTLNTDKILVVTCRKVINQFAIPDKVMSGVGIDSTGTEMYCTLQSVELLLEQ